MTGELGVHPYARGMLYSEIKTFDPTKADNKDNCLDVASYANLVKLKFPTEIQSNILLFHSTKSTGVVDVGMKY